MLSTKLSQTTDLIPASSSPPHVGFGVSAHSSLRTASGSALSPPTWSGSATAIRLKSNLWRELSWGQLPVASLSDIDQVVDRFNANLTVLNQRLGEMVTFLRNTYCVNVVFQSEHGVNDRNLPDELLSDAAKELASLSKLRPRCVNALTAELVTQPSEVVAAELHLCLSSNISVMVDGLLETLNRMSDRNILGELTWLPGNVCRFDFHRKQVVQTSHNQSRITEHHYVLHDGTVLTSDPVWQDRLKVSRPTTTELVTYAHTNSHHGHHVMHAVRPAPENCAVTMPDNVAHYWSEIPSWIGDTVQLVHGKLIREDVHVEHYEERKVIQRVEPITVEQFDAGQCPPCPALVIGDVVLTGWTPSEIATQEQLKLQRTKLTKFVLAERRLEILAGVSGIAAGLVYALDSERTPLMGYCAGGLLVYSVACLAAAVAKWLRHWKWKA